MSGVPTLEPIIHVEITDDGKALGVYANPDPEFCMDGESLPYVAAVDTQIHVDVQIIDRPQYLWKDPNLVEHEAGAKTTTVINDGKVYPALGYMIDHEHRFYRIAYLDNGMPYQTKVAFNE
jgi:hypothetical protein